PNERFTGEAIQICGRTGARCADDRLVSRGAERPGRPEPGVQQTDGPMTTRAQPTVVRRKPLGADVTLPKEGVGNAEVVHRRSSSLCFDIRLRTFSKSNPAPRTGTIGSFISAKRLGTVFIVKRLGSSLAVTSSHVSGQATGAPGRGRTENGATIVCPGPF